eukprot:252116-Chlamydomonas_euryale.AAC.1
MTVTSLHKFPPPHPACSSPRPFPPSARLSRCAIPTRAPQRTKATNLHVQECERNRIEAAGGTVLYVKGSWRVILPDLETQMMKVWRCGCVAAAQNVYAHGRTHVGACTHAQTS